MLLVYCTLVRHTLITKKMITVLIVNYQNALYYYTTILHCSSAYYVHSSFLKKIDYFAFDPIICGIYPQFSNILNSRLVRRIVV